MLFCFYWHVILWSLACLFCQVNQASCDTNSAGIGLSLLFCILLNHTLSANVLLAGLFFIMGILCCYQVIVFSEGQVMVPKALLGICIAFLNSINMLGGSFFHTLIGQVMDLFWQGAVNQQGLKVYAVSTYQHALAVIPVSALVGVFYLYLKQREVSGALFKQPLVTQ